MKALTDYQEMQLRSVHFTGEFQYTTEQGTKVAPKAWRKMIDTLVNGGYIEFTPRGNKRLTAAGKAYMEARH